MKRFILNFAILICISTVLHAQQTWETLDLGNFKAPVHSDGQLFTRGTDGHALLAPSPNFPGTEKSLAFTGHLWLGGMDNNGTLRVSAQTYLQNGQDFFPGPDNSPGYDRVWKISRAEIQQFQTDFQNGTVNFANYPTIQTWPAFMLDAQGNTLSVAPFVDLNGNPFDYDPLAGDHPDIRPVAGGVEADQAIFAYFNDFNDSVVNAADTSYLGLRIALLAYVYDCPDSTIDQVCYLKYEVANMSTNTYTDFRTGLFMDFELGNPLDDYVASVISENTCFVYNADVNDDTVAGGFGMYPPAFGMRLLNQQASGASYFLNDFSVMGNPATKNDYYNYLQSKWKDSTPMVAAGNGYGAGTPAYWAFADTGWCSGQVNGWSEMVVNNPQGDRRAVLSNAQWFGALYPGNIFQLHYALMYRNPEYTVYNSSICEMLNLSDDVQTYFDLGYTPCSVPLSTQSPHGEKEKWAVYPNPAQENLSLQAIEPSAGNYLAEIFNLHGQKLMSREYAAISPPTLDLSTLTPGLYLLRISGEGKATSLRFVKE